jgi:hypothetical protein
MRIPNFLFVAVTFTVTLLVCLKIGADVPHSPVTPVQSESAKLARGSGQAFTSGKKGEYAFDTGIVRGQLRQAGRSLGLSSVVHIRSNVRLDGGFGIFSYYRIFTTNTRYGTAAWDWPSASRLLSDGAVQITWPEKKGRPFEITAIYRWQARTTLDLETIVTAREDLPDFEVFLASYFDETFSSPYVYVGASPEAEGRPGFLLARKSFGDWQMFPRNQQVLQVIHDGRWEKEPHPVKWAIMPCMAAPIALRRSAKADLVVVLMAPPQDCFAISTPYQAESHNSLYLSLFGRSIRAGETARARSRLIVTTAVSDQEILRRYHQYRNDLNTRATADLPPAGR